MSEQTVVPDTLPRRRFPLAATSLWILAAVPVVLALAEAVRSPRLNFVDFWLVLGKITTPDGALRPGELLELHNDHPIVLAGLAFFADAKLFSGANWTLGVFSVLLAGVVLVSLWSMLPARLTGIRRAAVMVAVSALIFSSAATEYWGIGMSGTHWMLGFAPAAAALAFAHRGRTIPALLLGVVAGLGHGAGLPVWAGLALIAWLRRDRPWRVVVPLVVGVAGALVWLLAPRPPAYPPPAIIGADTYLGATLSTLGQAWSVTALDVAYLAGALTIAVFTVIVTQLVRARLAHTPGQTDVDQPVDQADVDRPEAGRAKADKTVADKTVADETVADDAGWTGLAVYVVLIALMIGISRGKLSNAEGLSPRYEGIALLGAAAVVVLLAVRGPRRLRTHVVPFALVVALLSYAVGSSWATVTRNKYPTQPELAVAMRVEANGMISKLLAYPQFLPQLRALKVYPFTDDFTLGCGGPELGSTVDIKSARELSPPGINGQTAGVVETGDVTGDTEITGWAMVNGQTVDCVLVTDSSGLVVGGGAVGLPRRDVLQVVAGTGRSGWKAVARPGTKNGVVLVVAKGIPYRISTVLGK